MNVLILGINGFIGSHLSNKLSDEGCNVYGADIKDNEFHFSVGKIYKGDLRDINFVESLFSSIDSIFDEVYQLAADMGGATYINCGLNDADVMSNSILINVNVAKCCVKYKSKRLFFSSSACIYPPTGENSTSGIEEVAYPAFPDNEYGWEKLFSERMYMSFYRQYGLEVRIARFHSIVGDYSTYRGGKEKAHSALIRKVLMVEDKGVIEVIGDGKQLRTFLYVKDCINAIVKLIRSDCREVINIGSDFVISINDYVNMIKDISGKDFTIKHIDGSTGIIERFCDITKVKKYLEWSPTYSLLDSTRITYDWISKELQKRINVLFVTQKTGFYGDENGVYCGIGIRGKLTSDILKNSQFYNFIQCFHDNDIELEQSIIKYDPKIIIYNYHELTTAWVKNSTIIRKYINIKHVMVHYDITQHKIDNLPNYQHIFCGFKYIITDNDTLTLPEFFFCVSRSIINHTGKKNDNKIVKIGTQGFAVNHKGLDHIVEKVQEEFDEAIINFNLPFSFYEDKNGNNTLEIVDKLRRKIYKEGIILNVSHNFLNDEQIIEKLSENDINCYFYNIKGEIYGLASSPDYAIAARRPIAVTENIQLRHLNNLIPSINIEKNSLKEIINNGITPLLPLYEKYSHENVIKSYEKVCNTLLNM